MKIKRIGFAFITFIACLALLLVIKPGKPSQYFTTFELTYESSDIMQIYFGKDIDHLMFESQEVGVVLPDNGSQDMQLSLGKEVRYIGLYLGDVENNINISNINMNYLFFNEQVNYTNFISKNNIIEITTNDSGISVVTNSGQSYIIYDVQSYFDSINESAMKVLYVIYFIISLVIFLISFAILPNIKNLWYTIKDIFNNRRLLLSFSKNDFKMRYAGVNLGVFWAFVQPIVTIMIYVFIFQYGFKSVPVENVPYVLWLVSAIIPWFFFNEGLNNATNSLVEYSYLVKKVVFKVNILPVVKILSALYIHIFFICIAFALYFINGIGINIYIVQIIYYCLATIVLLLGLGYLTSSLMVFFRDLGQIVSIFLQFGMWLVPIMWPLTMISPKWQYIIKLNPMYYITDGYRDAFYNHVWFWEKPGQTLYFWIIAILLLIIGTTMFKKLEKHFADVL